MNSQPRLIVLLSTYNGEEFIAQQLDSLFNQTYPDFLILARDDGSSDSSYRILADYALRTPEKLRLISDETANLGASGSFAWLLNYALKHKGELGVDKLYVMFCDQDDVWYENKMTRQMNAMLTAEAESISEAGDEMAVLVHSDLQVVDEKLQPIAESFVNFQGLKSEENGFPDLLISNLVTGCTALMNEPLARKVLPIPNDAIMHDWWLALVASAFGKLIYLDIPLVHYRQHSNNAIGAKERQQDRVGTFAYWGKLIEMRPNQHLVDAANQARAFRAQYNRNLNKQQLRALRYCSALAFRFGVWQRFVFKVLRQL